MRTSWAPLVATLAVSQIIGWGTTYYMPAVLGTSIGTALGIGRETSYLGVSLMVGISALVAPSAGRLLDRLGAARLMAPGTALIGCALLLLAALPSQVTYCAMWVMLGLAAPFGLSLGALTSVTQATGSAARRTIGILMLFTGMSATVFWPLGSWLDHLLGWRGAVAGFALLNLCLSLPLNLIVVRGFAAPRPHPAPGSHPTRVAASTGLLVEAATRERAAWLMIITFSLQGFVSWGLPLLMISMFEALDLRNDVAVTIAALNGPATIAARLMEIFGGARLKPMTTALVALGIVPATLLALLLPLPPVVAATVFAVLYCGATGVLAIVRATLPLTLLGALGYGTLIGRLSLPQNLIFAASPALFGLVEAHGGLDGVIALALLVSLAAFASAYLLTRLVEASLGVDASTLPSRGV